MEEEWFEGPPATGEEGDETVYYEAEEKDETMYYDAEGEQSVYYEAEADETVYYEAERGGSSENAPRSPELADEGVECNATPDIAGTLDEPDGKGEEFEGVAGLEYTVPPEAGEEGGAVSPEIREEHEVSPEDREVFEEPAEKGEEYDVTPGNGEEFEEPAERGEEYDMTPGNGGEFEEPTDCGADYNAPPEGRRESFQPSNDAQASRLSAAKEQVPPGRPRSFMAQMASLLLKRRGCRGRASVERYKEARNLKRKTAARAKRSELNKISWALSKAADETEPEPGWAERQKEKVRAWRAEREAKPDWAENQLKFILEWRESQNAYALRQYKRALSQAGVFRSLQRPTLSDQLAALAAYRARMKEEAFYEAEKARPGNWPQGAGGKTVTEGIKPNLPKAAINQFLPPGFSPMHMLPVELWFQPPFKATRGLLPTPKSGQPNLSKAAAVHQEPGPENVAPQTWHKPPLNVNRGFQEPPGSLQPNPQPPARRDLAPSTEHVPSYPVHTRPHASWHQAPMNAKSGFSPMPWC